MLPNQKELKQLFKEHNQAYGEDKIREQAAVDASLGIPKAEQEEPSPFERELLYADSRLASLISSKYKGPLELVDARVKTEEDFVKRRFENTIQKVEAIYQAEKDAAEDAYGLQDSHKQLEVAEIHYNKMYEKYGRGPIEYIPHWLYLVLATLIFLGEIPLNALVFQIFGENQVMTWIMAIIIGLCVPLNAHFVGIKAREHANGFSLSNFIKAIIALIIIVTALYGLSIMRQTYLSEFREQLGLTEGLVHTSFLFFWLNLAVLGAAIMVAYLSHDSVPGFQRAEDDVRDCRKHVEKKEFSRMKALKKAALLRAEQFEQANKDLRDGMSQVIRLKGEYDYILKEGQECESRCLDSLMRELSLYRRENLRIRQDKTVPKSFDVELAFKLELEKFGEKLLNDEGVNTVHV